MVLFCRFPAPPALRDPLVSLALKVLPAFLVPLASPSLVLPVPLETLVTMVALVLLEEVELLERLEEEEVEEAVITVPLLEQPQDTRERGDCPHPPWVSDSLECLGPVSPVCLSSSICSFLVISIIFTQ